MPAVIDFTPHAALPSPILSKTADSDLKIAIKQQVVDVSLKDPLEDSLERRWQLASQSDLKGAIEELVQKSPVVVSLYFQAELSQSELKLFFQGILQGIYNCFLAYAVWHTHRYFPFLYRRIVHSQKPQRSS